MSATPSVHEATQTLEASLRSSESLDQKLSTARVGLLDLSARNRLLNTPRSAKNKRMIEVVDERSTEILRLLVHEERAFTFTAGRAASPTSADADGDTDEIAELAQPDESEVDGRGVLMRHADTRLQTRLTSKGLQRRLLDIYTDAVTLEQEQGANILFLALGMLKWVDPRNAENVRFAPLVLVPVALERTTAADRIRLRWRGEDVAANLSLQAFLDREHKLRMPEFESDDFDHVSYCRRVAETISLKSGWQVLPDDIVLGFFSFTKFLMYRDLDPECWPAESKLTSQPILCSLLQEGFPEQPSTIPDGSFVDPYISPANMLHVADCDSSQMAAVQDARQGRNLVIQGPPGTGKSQTIANIIAAAVADGKTVLFVAEKMVALSVVKSRLDRAGVGDACLELHSSKANKRTLLQELKRTWELGAPHANRTASLEANLQDVRTALNAHAQEMHQRDAISGLTPFEVVGELVSLARQGRPPRSTLSWPKLPLGIKTLLVSGANLSETSPSVWLRWVCPPTTPGGVLGK